EATIAIRRRSGDVVGIARQTIADDFAIDLGTTGLSTLVVFEDHDTGAFAHDEAVTILVVRTRGSDRVVVEAGGQSAGRSKAGQREPVHAAFRAASNHDVGITQGDETGGIANGMRAGRTGGDHGVVRTLET